MKSYKLFIESTNTHNELVDILQDIIEKDNKTINGFEFGVEQSGAFEWNSKDYYMYATPYWDGNMYLAINIMNKDGDDIYQNQIKLPELKNTTNVSSVIKNYYIRIDEVTKDLNKKAELKKYLKIILKSIETIRIEGYFYVHSDDYTDVFEKIDKLSDSDIINISNIINKKYSDILSANKFNL
jgi:hypothetical protein